MIAVPAGEARTAPEWRQVSRALGWSRHTVGKGRSPSITSHPSLATILRKYALAMGRPAFLWCGDDRLVVVEPVDGGKVRQRTYYPAQWRRVSRPDPQR